MVILNVAYSLFPVSPDSGGGAEQVLALIDRGITELGYKSLVIGTQSSKTSGRLIPTPDPPDARITEEHRRSAYRNHRLAIQQALETENIDIIHFHGLDFLEYLPATHRPCLATLHLPIAWYSESIFKVAGLSLNCVSASQAQSHPSSCALPVVPNGIDSEYLGQKSMPEDHDGPLLFLGRICPEKGVHIALRIAHTLDQCLDIAGPVHPFPDHQRYFAIEVEPLFDRKRRYVGPVGAVEKRRLLASARCVIIPSLVAETSSLVAMEAVCSGTPVVAFRTGALPEIVRDGVTGFVVSSEQEMLVGVRAIRDLPSTSADIIVRSRKRFSYKSMVKKYLDLYKSLLNSTNQNSSFQNQLTAP